MKVHGPSTTTLQHMAQKAQEVRKSFNPVETGQVDAAAAGDNSVVGKKPESGNNVPAPGENLPPSSNAQPEHAAGLARAIERLEANAIKNPQAKGLLQALGMLQQNLNTSNSVDTVA